MRKNVASIQFLRFVAATLVVLFHATEAANLYFVGSIPSLLMHVATFGASGVHIFFVISGFVMIYTSFYNENDNFSSSKFLTKRIIRIYPIYFVYSFCYLAFYHFFSVGKNLSIEQFIQSIVLFPGHSSDIIGPGWTLSFEIYFYACFSIAMRLGLRRGMLALALFFVAAIVSGFWLDQSQETIHVLTSTLLIEFLLGALIGYAVVTSVRIGNQIANMMLALAFTGFFAGIVFGYTHLPSLVTWGIPSALLVAGFVFRENNGRVPILIKNYSFLGDSSYSLYLLHVVLIDAVILFAIYLDDSIRMHVSLMGPFVMIIVCFAITAYCVAVAYIAYELFERRIVTRLQDLFRRKTAVTPATIT